jgi:hypothetical protein
MSTDYSGNNAQIFNAKSGLESKKCLVGRLSVFQGCIKTVATDYLPLTLGSVEYIIPCIFRDLELFRAELSSNHNPEYR